MEEDIRKETLKRVAHELAVIGQKQNAPLGEEQIMALLEQRLMTVIPEVTEVRPQVLECDVVRFQNNKEKWVALVGLLDGYHAAQDGDAWQDHQAGESRRHEAL